jgi:hypothetical protein
MRFKSTVLLIWEVLRYLSYLPDIYEWQFLILQQRFKLAFLQ